MAAPDPQRRILVTDFDGTITTHDFFGVVAPYRTVDAADYWTRYKDGALSHFAAMQAIFASIRATDAEMEAVLDALAPDPELGAAIARLRGGGWEVVVASAGCRWYIDQILERAGVRQAVAVHASPGRFLADRGLLMRADPTSPFFSAETGIDKAAVVRDAQARAATVAFAGDGPTDVEAARLVDPVRRFLRGAAAARLARTGEPYRGFKTWSAIADALLDAERRD